MLTEEEVHLLEIDEKGRLNHLTRTTIYRDGIDIGTTNHRELVNPESPKYQARLLDVVNVVIPSLNISQEKSMQEMDADLAIERDLCDSHKREIEQLNTIIAEHEKTIRSYQTTERLHG